MKVYIVIGDNGQSYSDQSDWIVCVCSTEEKAKERIRLIEEWRENNRLPSNWYELNPQPAVEACPYDQYLLNTSYSFDDYTWIFQEMEVDA